MPEENQANGKKRRFVLLGLFLLFVVIGTAIFIYWALVLKFEESTDDAYVNGNQIVVTPQTSGFIAAIHVDETDIVREGNLLVSLDTTDQTIAFEEAKHALAAEIRQIVGLFERVAQRRAEQRVREIEKIKASQDYEHRKSLLEGGAVTFEQYEHAEAAYLASLQEVSIAEHQLRAAIAEVDYTTIETHPRVEEAKDRVRKTFVDLQRCRILAPATGMIAQRQAQIGEAVKPGAPLMLLIPLDQMWVDANFKETQLKNVRIGQPVSLTSDFYGSLPFHGKVIGLWPGTGSVFSVLPPQNATGNWIKIVQRLPVRIGLEPDELKKYPLRLGLSMDVTIDIHDRDGEVLPVPVEASTLFQTTIYDTQLEGVEDIIAQIIRENRSFFPQGVGKPSDE